MNFIEIRDHSAGYEPIFKGGMPVNYGEEVSDSSTELMVENARDALGDRDCKLCRASDGKLYRVYGDEYTAVKVWEEVELIPDRSKRFRDFREFSGTLRETQEKTGILVQNISKYENG